MDLAPKHQRVQLDIPLNYLIELEYSLRLHQNPLSSFCFPFSQLSNQDQAKSVSFFITFHISLIMSSNKSSQALRTEVSKLARLSNIQGGLPPLMRGLPVLAIMAGEAIAKTTNTTNMIEERILGADEVFILQSPQESTRSTAMNDIGRPGVNLMCQTCGQKTGKIQKEAMFDISRAHNSLKGYHQISRNGGSALMPERDMETMRR